MTAPEDSAAKAALPANDQPPAQQFKERLGVALPQKLGKAGQQKARPGAPRPGVSPNVIQALLRDATALFEKNQPVAAEAKLLELLGKAPGHPDALMLQYRIKRKQNRANEAIEALRKLVKAHPNNIVALGEIAMQLFLKGDRAECEVHARNAIRAAPRNPQAHNMMGLIMTETNRAIAGEYHYRRALELGGPNARLCANLAINLKNQSKMDESEKFFEESLRLDPKAVNTYLNYARMEEARRNFKKAWELLKKAEELAPEGFDLTLTRAVLHGREKHYEQAIAELNAAKEAGKKSALSSVHHLERGRLLDKLERFDEAWADFTEGKRIVREVQGRAYHEKAAAALVARLKNFFTRQRLQLLPRAGLAEDTLQPIFIVGFPRSGTTMLEQTIGAHPAICASDELPFINDLTRIMPRMLNSPLSYPDALADLWMGDNQLALDNMRDFYLKRTEQLGVLREGARWFTDKMPLNETHLGFISLLFPKSPVIHLRRHPLDVVTSVYSNYLTHGFNCAFDLKTIAQHYALIYNLVEHYRQNVDMRYLSIKYEDLVADQEPNVRKILEFIDEPFDPRCLSFHENTRYARTASYAQVTEKLYDSSVYRFRHYRKHMEPIMPLLEPIIRELGYPTE